MFPLLMCLFIIGFFMYSLGDRKKNKTQKTPQKAHNNEDLTFISAINEEREEEIYA